jgi:hypothetical protein
MRFLPILAGFAIAMGGMLSAEAQGISKAASLDTPPSSRMTVKERRRVCALIVDGLDSGYASQTAEQQRAFLRRCMNKDCDFLVQFIAAQEKREQAARPVVFTMTQPIGGYLEVYPFLTKDFSADAKVNFAENRAAGEAGINLLFVFSPLCTTPQGCNLHVYVDDGTGYKKAAYNGDDQLLAGVSRADGKVSLFFAHSEGRIGPPSLPREYTLKGETFERTEPHEGC